MTNAFDAEPASESMCQQFKRSIAAPTHRCPVCKTGYFEQQECDWCAGVEVVAGEVKEEQRG